MCAYFVKKESFKFANSKQTIHRQMKHTIRAPNAILRLKLVRFKVPTHTTQSYFFCRSLWLWHHVDFYLHLYIFKMKRYLGFCLLFSNIYSRSERRRAMSQYLLNYYVVGKFGYVRERSKWIKCASALSNLQESKINEEERWMPLGNGIELTSSTLRSVNTICRSRD